MDTILLDVLKVYQQNGSKVQVKVSQVNPTDNQPSKSLVFALTGDADRGTSTTTCFDAPSSLDFDWNALRISYADHLPPQIGQLRSLQFLTLLDSKTLEELPPQIGDLIHLEKLYISHCGAIPRLPRELAQLRNLKELRFGYCEALSELPAGPFSTLERLSLTYCRSLTHLPPEIGEWSNLRELKICSCEQLTSIPHEIGNLSRMETLEITSCRSLLEIPSTIGQLKSLTKLEIVSCGRLHLLPVEIGELANLQSLLLHETQFQCLPPEISKLAKLQTFALTGCKLPPTTCHKNVSLGNVVRTETKCSEELCLLSILPRSIRHIDVERTNWSVSFAQLARATLPPRLRTLNLKHTSLHAKLIGDCCCQLDCSDDGRQCNNNSQDELATKRSCLTLMEQNPYLYSFVGRESDILLGDEECQQRADANRHVPKCQSGNLPASLWPTVFAKVGLQLQGSPQRLATVIYSVVSGPAFACCQDRIAMPSGSVTASVV